MSTHVLVVFVPTTHTDAVRQAMGNAGAGKIGNYTYCSFSVVGTGRFLPNQQANPAIGHTGELNAVPEERIETVCEDELLHNVIQAIKAVHPYEEPLINVYPLTELR